METSDQENIEVKPSDTIGTPVRRHTLRSRIIEVELTNGDIHNGVDSAAEGNENLSVNPPASAVTVKEPSSMNEINRRSTRSSITNHFDKANDQKIISKQVEQDKNSLDDPDGDHDEVVSATQSSPLSHCGSEASDISVRVLRNCKIIPLPNAINKLRDQKPVVILKGIVEVLEETNEEINEANADEDETKEARNSNSDKMTKTDTDNDTAKPSDKITEKEAFNDETNSGTDSCAVINDEGKDPHNKSCESEIVNRNSRPLESGEEEFTETNLEVADNDDVVNSSVTDLSNESTTDKTDKNFESNKVTGEELQDEEINVASAINCVNEDKAEKTESDSEVVQSSLFTTEVISNAKQNSEQENTKISLILEEDVIVAPCENSDEEEINVESDSTEEFVCVKKPTEREPIISSTENGVVKTINKDANPVDQKEITVVDSEDDAGSGDESENLNVDDISKTTEITAEKNTNLKNAFCKNSGILAGVKSPIKLSTEKPKGSFDAVTENKSNEEQLNKNDDLVSSESDTSSSYSYNEYFECLVRKDKSNKQVVKEAEKIKENGDVDPKLNLLKCVISNRRTVLELDTKSENRKNVLSKQATGDCVPVKKKQFYEKSMADQLHDQEKQHCVRFEGLEGNALKNIVKAAVTEAVGELKKELLDVKKEFINVKDVLDTINKGKKRKHDDSDDSSSSYSSTSKRLKQREPVENAFQVPEGIADMKQELVDIKKELTSVINVLNKLSKGKKRKLDERSGDDVFSRIQSVKEAKSTENDCDFNAYSSISVPIYNEAVKNFENSSLDTVKAKNKKSQKKSKKKLVLKMLQQASSDLQMPIKMKKKKLESNLSSGEAVFELNDFDCSNNLSFNPYTTDFTLEVPLREDKKKKKITKAAKQNNSTTLKLDENHFRSTSNVVSSNIERVNKKKKKLNTIQSIDDKTHISPSVNLLNEKKRKKIKKKKFDTISSETNNSISSPEDQIKKKKRVENDSLVLEKQLKKLRKKKTKNLNNSGLICNDNSILKKKRKIKESNKEHTSLIGNDKVLTVRFSPKSTNFTTDSTLESNLNRTKKKLKSGKDSSQRFSPTSNKTTKEASFEGRRKLEPVPSCNEEILLKKVSMHNGSILLKKVNPWDNKQKYRTTPHQGIKKD